MSEIGKNKNTVEYNRLNASIKIKIIQAKNTVVQEKCYELRRI